jgi:membrane fusion protein (multidrug efflux system)
MARTGEKQHGFEQVENQPPEHHEKELAPHPASPQARRKLLRIGIPVVLLILLVAAYFWWHGRNRVSTDDAQVDGHIAPISAKVAGSVLQVLADYNQRVTGGQVLVRLDPRDYQALVDQARSAVQVAEAQANAARVGVPLTRATTASGTSGAAAQLGAAEAEHQRSLVSARQAETSGVAAAQANVAEADANNRRAQADLARMQPLVEKQEISRQQFDAVAAAAQVAAAQLRAAQEQLRAAQQSAENAQAAAQSALARVEAARAALQESRAGEQQVNVRQAEAQSAQATVERARANLAQAELNLSYATIVAPVSGVVTNRNVERGQIVQPGQGLMTIVPLEDIWVTANFKETQLAHVHPGQHAEVHVDMYGESFPAHVDSIAAATGARTSLLPPENATGNFVKVVQRIPVRIRFDSLPRDFTFRPGMNVDAVIFTK